MEYRFLGGSGLQVPVLSFGTATFGGGTDFFKKWGSTDVAEATRMVDICLEAGVNLFDTANVYSKGLSEEILGQAIKGKRKKLLMPFKHSSMIALGKVSNLSFTLHGIPVTNGIAIGRALRIAPSAMDVKHYFPLH